MILFRSFLNSDPPALADIWRSQPPLPGRLPVVTAGLLEALVFAKPYFDRHGLIVACEGARPIGFAHAGFGPDETGAALDYRRGAICQALVVPHDRRAEVALELVAAAEDYLRRKGAGEALGGEAAPITPFYRGLYGNGDQAGVLASDAATRELYSAAGYVPRQRSLVLRRTLADFKAPVDREQMLVRRKFQLTIVPDIPAANWWEACAWGLVERTRFDLVPRPAGSAVASAWCWDVQPLGKALGMRLAGLIRLDGLPQAQESGWFVCLLADALKQLLQQGFTHAETIVADDDADRLALFAALGFVPVDEAISLVRPI